VTATLKQRHGVAADEILREALESAYDLIVIGASGTAGRLREWLLGNVTRQVVEHALCSVLVVKRSGDHDGRDWLPDTANTVSPAPGPDF
jgi:nucleotide-binding universal stress UspA family protein